MGYILYKSKINNPYDIEVVDLIPLSKGTSFSVDIDMTKQQHIYLQFMEAHPEYYDMMEEDAIKKQGFILKTGLIHSHNTMSTLFSGTDNDELKENADKYPEGYLSLICNNYGSYNAKIGLYTEAKYLVFGVEKVSKIYNTINCDIILENLILPDGYKELYDNMLLEIEKVGVIKRTIFDSSINYQNDKFHYYDGFEQEKLNNNEKEDWDDYEDFYDDLYYKDQKYLNNKEKKESFLFINEIINGNSSKIKEGLKFIDKVKSKKK